jgi:Cu-Zn family superoxide dismutase
MRRASLPLLLATAALMACASVADHVAIQAADTGPRRDRSDALGPDRATAQLQPTYGHTAAGTVHLRAGKDGAVRVVAELSGLPPGAHGFHVHEKGDCSAPDGKSAGDHFNPDKVDHGAPAAMPHHAGDFGNLTAGPDGKATMTVTVDFVSLDDGPRSAIGRAIVIHEKADDLKTQPSGNAGARIACGVINAAK